MAGGGGSGLVRSGQLRNVLHELVVRVEPLDHLPVARVVREQVREDVHRRGDGARPTPERRAAGRLPLPTG